jgi:hypothetical protein
MLYKLCRWWCSETKYFLRQPQFKYTHSTQRASNLFIAGHLKLQMQASSAKFSLMARKGGAFGCARPNYDNLPCHYIALIICTHSRRLGDHFLLGVECDLMERSLDDQTLGLLVMLLTLCVVLCYRIVFAYSERA